MEAEKLINKTDSQIKVSGLYVGSFSSFLPIWVPDKLKLLPQKNMSHACSVQKRPRALLNLVVFQRPLEKKKKKKSI